MTPFPAFFVSLLFNFGQSASMNFDSDALSLFRSDVESLILANNEGITFDSEWASPQDVIIPVLDLVLIPALVRLAFHDCAGAVPGACDGCIDINNFDNAGLYEGAILPMEPICNEYKQDYGLSRADCWSLASTIAIEVGQEQIASDWEMLVTTIVGAPLEPGAPATSQTIFVGDIPYYVGREDKSDCNDFTNSDETFPDPDLGWDHARDYFQERFDMTNKQIAALIAGAHSLGRGHLKMSGYAGAWDATTNQVDNEYARELITHKDRFGIRQNWQSGNVSSSGNAEKQFFFEGVIGPAELSFSDLGFPQDKLFLMLNCDIELVYDLSYYLENELFDRIDCSTDAKYWCAENEPDAEVRYAGEEEVDGVTYCTFAQCPVKCAESDLLDLEQFTALAEAGDTTGTDENSNCPVAWMYDWSVNEDNLGEFFIQSYTIMITAGYQDNQRQTTLTALELPFDCKEEFGEVCNWCRKGVGCMGCRRFFERVMDEDSGMYVCERSDTPSVEELDYIASKCANENCEGEENEHCAVPRGWGCKRCKSGYFQKNHDYLCVECSIIPHCETCSIDDREWLGCDRCESGYTRTWDAQFGYRRCLQD